MKIDLQWSGLEEQLKKMEAESLHAYDVLVEGKGEGHEFLGWIDLPENYDREEYDRIKKAAKRIREDADALVIIGIGGSYLGARAVIEALSPTYERMRPEILFAGNHLSAQETSELLAYLKGKKVYLNVISKSGTTTEPAIAFRLLKEQLIAEAGAEEAAKRIFVTTDRNRGALKSLATEEGYETFVVPDDVGGRFTVLTAVGLLPIAAAGIDIDALMAGARAGRKTCMPRNLENPAIRYAIARNLLYQQRKKIEVLVAYEPKLRFFQEWWKQLYGESEGKEGKALFPASVSNTTDLHSLGQLIQEGERTIFETILAVQNSADDVLLHAEEGDLDGLNYLAGKKLSEVNRKAMQGTLEAHVTGGVPNLIVEGSALDAHTMGEWIYFFEFAVGISGYMLGVNPFNQPGVEMYKTNMFRLLEKPGYVSVDRNCNKVNKEKRKEWN